MSKNAIAIAAALVLVGIAQPASALPSPSGEPPFRFAFNHSELASPVTTRALEARLNREATNYCRAHTSEGLSPVLTYGCRRSVIRAARTALAQARAGRG